MPELPEVETIKKDLLAHTVIGKKVVFNRLLNDKVFKTPFFKLDGLLIKNVERYGKYIIIRFEKSAMIVHLGMSGKLILDEGHVEIPKHTHFLIQMDDKWQIRFIDHRHFGKVYHMSYKECIDYVQSKLGPEPWAVNPESFILRIRQNKYLNKTIKEVLLDQKLIAGIGNIYASEICYESFIHPKTLVKDLNDNQLTQLLYNSRKVLDKAIKNCGTSFRDYRNAKNQTGNNQHYLKAYKQVECKRCELDASKALGPNDIIFPIMKEKIADRMSYWCPFCQKVIVNGERTSSNNQN